MDDVYRAEFPGPYYSTSSVYSYSPTSASDCPEHGRSRKKITCILTTSVIVATLCVLSIAGVAAYLGILSKNISNNASQAAGEESFLLSESGGRIHSGGGSYTTEENEYIFTTNDDNGGLDALDGVPGDSLVDLSNSLSESSSRGSSTPDARKTTPTPPARTIEGHYANIDAVYRNAIINSNDNMLPSNLVTHRPPPPHEEDNSVRFFTEEASTSSKPFTKLPPRHNRNRQRFPLTNSHSLGPSTTTMVTTTMEGGDDTTASNNSGGNTHEGKADHEKHDSEVPHISDTENDKNSGDLSVRTDDGGNAVSSSTVANREDLAATVGIDSSTFFSSTESSATTTNRVNNNFDVLGEDQKLSTQALRPISKLRDKDREQEEFTSSSPINGNTKVKQNLSVTSFNVHNVNENDNAMQADGAGEDNEDMYNNHHNNRRYHKNHRPDNGQHLLNNKDGVTSFPVDPEMFKPMHPIVSSEREDGMGLLNKKDKPLAFDKVSPEYYDNQPWVPLLNRPNLDKRPRVDLENAHLSSTEPIIVWNSDEPEESVEFPPHLQPGHANFTEGPIPTMDVIYGHGANFTVSTYYGYGHSGPSSETDVDPHKMSNPNPGSNLNKPSHPVQQSNKNNETRNQTQGLMNGFRPSNIPAYTILIPHIPNPPHASNVSITTPSQDTDTLISPHLSPPEDYANSYNKLDRMGVAAEEGPTGAEADNADRNGDGKEKAGTEKKNKNGDRITYNFEAIKTIPVPQDDDDLKDDDYVDADIDEFTESVQGEPKIYRLDPDSVDLVPDTLGTAQKRPPFSTSSTTSTSTVSSNIETTEGNSGEEADSHAYDDSVEQKENEAKMQNSTSVKDNLTSKKNGTKDFDKEFSPASMELVIGPQEPDLLVKSTTDLIMSTLGSLNLIKAPAKELTEEEINEKLRNSDVHNQTETDELSPTGNKTGGPLFPPVRSYVGINQPLRPKPNRTESANSNNKQFRFSDEKAEATLNFPPDTTASLQKVLSMMLGGDIGGGEHSRNLADHPLIKGLLNKQNVTLIVANETGAPSIISLGDVLPTVLPTMRQTPTTESSVKGTTPVASSSHRDPKSFYTGNRESKIDAQFTTATDFEHVPVPLMTETPAQPNQPEVPLHLTGFPWSSKPPKASSKVHNNNSPVYKFVLKKGQSVEDLLKEIFLNYTEGNSSVSSNLRESNAGVQQIPVKLGMKEGHGNNNPGFKSLEDINVEEPSHTESSTTPVRISHHVETTPELFNAPHPTDLSSMEELSQEVQTSTSVVVHEEMEDYGCGANDTFRCVSDGRCIPSYLRCNFIKECDDNSDEEGCLCADFLRANGNDRKLCDGIPDCADASDEYQDCQYCQPGQYICAGTRSCINKEEVCNSKRDCRFGDDEENCFKLTPEDKRSVLGEIGQKDIASLKDDFSPTYHKKGHLMVRKMGTWGKLCVESFSSVVSHWEVKDLARAVCKALTFADYETVEKVKDLTPNSTEPYYELHYGSSNQTSSGEAHQRPGLGFRQTECKSKLVVNVTCQDLQCGVAPRAYTQRARYRVTRIVGGANSLPGKWPWQAALYKNGEYQCGATLISSRWLLSAGHCFYHAQDDYWVARLGTLRRGATVLSPYEQVVRITHIFLHPEYKDVGFINDVSLLRLEQEVNFTDFVRPVCLPGKESRIRDGRMCTVVGWGQLFEVGRVFPDTLQEVQLPLISTGECRKRTLFLPLYKLTDEMFCAGFDRGGRDACLGDSGGPLMCPESDGRWSLYGVTSNGYGCARANRPGVYTKVTSYLDWIYDKMSQDSAFTYRDKSKPCEGHRCLLGECLEKRQVCNGIRDCIEDDGSDERGPNCTMNAYLT